MSSLFCCSSISPYRAKVPNHEAKSKAFTSWANLQTNSKVPVDNSLFSTAPYAIQVVKQVRFGVQDWVRYFLPTGDGSNFAEVTDADLVVLDFEKQDACKRLKCGLHNGTFEIRVYHQRNISKTNYRFTNLARSSGDMEPLGKGSGTGLRNKRKAPPGQEEKQDNLPGGKKHKTSSIAGLVSSVSRALQGSDETAAPKNQSINERDLASLKSVLKFLLPLVDIFFNNNTLLILLSLDWVNATLKLDFSMERSWAMHLSEEYVESNLRDFFFVCEEVLDFPPDHAKSGIFELETLYKPAVAYVGRDDGQQPISQGRFRKIVDRIFEIGRERELRWVSKYGSSIECFLESGPGELIQIWQLKKYGISPV